MQHVAKTGQSVPALMRALLNEAGIPWADCETRVETVQRALYGADWLELDNGQTFDRGFVPKRTLTLVYQCGLANVFDGERRVLQHAYSVCETFCDGARAMGAAIEVKHCDKCGDVALFRAEWQDGPGDLWADKKRPA
jgi:hypothetical protein